MFTKVSLKKDRPHGEGKQYFDQGVYDGEFKLGKRHGKGTWETHDGKWKFTPVDGPQGNWENDEMHGIGTIEDTDYIHENVIFKKGTCQMPFTTMGPPASGFDEHLLFGPIMQQIQKAKFAAKGSRQSKHSAPTESVHAEQEKLSKAAVVRAKKTEHNRGIGGLTAPEEAAVIREDTDLTMPEEDLYLEGGSADNQLMNGVYWKVSNTFGVPIYKHYTFRREKTKKGHRKTGRTPRTPRVPGESPMDSPTNSPDASPTNAASSSYDPAAGASASGESGTETFVADDEFTGKWEVCERYLYPNENRNKWFIMENTNVNSLPHHPVKGTAMVIL